MLIQVYPDGNQMCAMEYGTCIPEAIAGFGFTIAEALIDFANQLGR